MSSGPKDKKTKFDHKVTSQLQWQQKATDMLDKAIYKYQLEMYKKRSRLQRENHKAKKPKGKKESKFSHLREMLLKKLKRHFGDTEWDQWMLALLQRALEKNAQIVTIVKCDQKVLVRIIRSILSPADDHLFELFDFLDSEGCGKKALKKFLQKSTFTFEEERSIRSLIKFLCGSEAENCGVLIDSINLGYLDLDRLQLSDVFFEFVDTLLSTSEHEIELLSRFLDTNDFFLRLLLKESFTMAFRFSESGHDRVDEDTMEDIEDYLNNVSSVEDLDLEDSPVLGESSECSGVAGYPIDVLYKYIRDALGNFDYRNKDEYAICLVQNGSITDKNCLSVYDGSVSILHSDVSDDEDYEGDDDDE